MDPGTAGLGTLGLGTLGLGTLGLGTLGLAFLAGLLSALSPCVLPLLPLVLGAAAAEHKGAPVLLALGVALSFVGVGLFVATIGFSIGFDAEIFRAGAAALMIAIGVVLLFPALQARVAAAGGPLSDRLNAAFGRRPSRGLAGQFSIGLLLGAVWSPCVGPTLGAASVLAAKGEDLAAVAVTMAAFGLGAAAPLLGLGLLSREAFARWRAPLLLAGKGLKQAMGLVFLALGLLTISGLDKRLEATLVSASPDWLTELATRF